jgi:hypothetical protein
MLAVIAIIKYVLRHSAKYILFGEKNHVIQTYLGV